MWVAALPVGISGKTLNSTFQSRDTNAYKVDNYSRDRSVALPGSSIK